MVSQWLDFEISAQCQKRKPDESSQSFGNYLQELFTKAFPSMENDSLQRLILTQFVRGSGHADLQFKYDTEKDLILSETIRYLTEYDKKWDTLVKGNADIKPLPSLFLTMLPKILKLLTPMNVLCMLILLGQRIGLLIPGDISKLTTPGINPRSIRSATSLATRPVPVSDFLQCRSKSMTLRYRIIQLEQTHNAILLNPQLNVDLSGHILITHRICIAAQLLLTARTLASTHITSRDGHTMLTTYRII